MKNKVKLYRIKLNLTQEKLAKISHVGQTTISNIETERYTPRVDTAIDLAKALQCTVEDLFEKER